MLIMSWKLVRAGQFQLCRSLCSTTNYIYHARVVTLLSSVRQQCAPAESLRGVTAEEVAEAVTAWIKGTAGVPKPRTREHPM